jgi:hypothetical protein
VYWPGAPSLFSVPFPKNSQVASFEPLAGLLGFEILARHNAIIDFGTRTL